MNKLPAWGIVFGVLICGSSAWGQSGSTPLQKTLVAQGFTNPVFMGSPPSDPRLFVVEQAGLIKIVKNGSVLPTPFLNITGLIQWSSESGLLGLAFHPNFASNGYFFVNYSRLGDNATMIARYQISSTNPDVANPASAKILFTVAQPFYNHNGGMLAFSPMDGLLYIGMGDGGSADDPMNVAQNPASLLGKMLRIDVNAANPVPEIWASGLRNPWRWSFDRMNGDMYIADVGQYAREEIDFEPAGSPGGRNYGWRCMEGTMCKGLSGCTCFSPTLTAPVHEYDHNDGNCCVIGGYCYRGAAIPDLRGTYFFSDYCSGRVWSLKMQNGVATQLQDRTVELLGAPMQYNIPSFGEDAQGEIYFADMGTGKIYRIEPKTPQMPGIAYFGDGTPGCSGPHALTPSTAAVVGQPMWQLICRKAPPNAKGLGLITDASSLLGTDPFGWSILVHLDFLSSSVLFPVNFASDAAGTGKASVPIPNIPGLAGITLHAQAYWYWPSGPCQPSPGLLSSSNGLSFTVLP